MARIPRTQSRYSKGLAPLLGLALLLAACGGGSGQQAGQAGSNTTQDNLRPITFVTDFGFLGRHAYYFVAKDKGYYKQAGLEVRFVGGSGSADAITTVASGQADLGFADMGTLVEARANDNVPVKEVAVVYQQAPHALFALAESGINQPQDLVGKTLSDSQTSSVYRTFEVYAKAAGIDPESVEWQFSDSSALPRLLAAGRVAAVGQYAFGEPLFEKSTGKKINVLRYTEVGLEFYSNGIIASNETIQGRKALVKDFVRATIKGMEYAFAHPKEAGRIFHKYHSEIAADVAAAETRIVAELATTNDTKDQGLGYIDPAKVADTINIMSEGFGLGADINPEELYAPGFTP